MKKRTKWFLIIVLLVFSVFSFTNNNPLVALGDQVTVQYEGTVGNHVFDTMIVTFQVGEGEVINGLDQGVIGMQLGEEKTMIINSEDGFGEYDLALVKEVSNELFTSIGESIPYEGEVLTIDGHRGKVLAVSDNTTIIDFNNELAGQDFNMTVKLLAHQQT